MSKVLFLPSVTALFKKKNGSHIQNIFMISLLILGHKVSWSIEFFFLVITSYLIEFFKTS